MNKKIRIAIFFGIIALGLGIIVVGARDILSHFDTGYRDGEKPFLYGYTGTIGLVLIALSPIALKKYIWSVILFGLQLLLYVWLYIDSLN